MKAVLIYLFYFAIFPGFLFCAIMGSIVSWIDRKVTARVQYRVGPPWYQNFADFFKLLGKETIIPEGSKGTGFLLSPLLGLIGITLVSTIIWLVNLGIMNSFVGDLIVVLYLLVLPSLAVILGASSSGNPLAGIGASREMKLMLGYELPLWLVMFIPVIKSGGMISLQNIIGYQAYNGAFLYSFSGVIGFIIALFCIQAKLGFVPFDSPEAETEIMSGTYIEYSGPALAVFKLTKAMVFFVAPVLLITVFWGGMHFNSVANSIYAILKYLVIAVLIILIKNTNPRLRIDQAMKFFWGRMSVYAVIGLLLAVIGY